jgi:hypothetical protein
MLVDVAGLNVPFPRHFNLLCFAEKKSSGGLCGLGSPAATVFVTGKIPAGNPVTNPSFSTLQVKTGSRDLALRGFHTFGEYSAAAGVLVASWLASLDRRRILARSLLAKTLSLGKVALFIFRSALLAAHLHTL